MNLGGLISVLTLLLQMWAGFFFFLRGKKISLKVTVIVENTNLDRFWDSYIDNKLLLQELKILHNNFSYCLVTKITFYCIFFNRLKYMKHISKLASLKFGLVLFFFSAFTLWKVLWEHTCSRYYTLCRCGKFCRDGLKKYFFWSVIHE